MPVDTSMYGNIQPTQPMGTLGSLVNTANAVNQYKVGQNQVVQSNIDNQEMLASRNILKDVQNYTDNRGNVDFNRLIPQIMSVAPKNGATIIQNVAGYQSKKTDAENAIMGQSTEANMRASNAIGSLDPTKVTAEDLQNTADAINKNYQSPNAQAATNAVFNHLTNIVNTTKPGDPNRAYVFKQASNMYLPIPTQQEINTPTPVQMNNQQQTWLQNIKPNVAGMPQNQPIPNTAVQQQLAPSTQIMQGNTPSYLGPQMGGYAPNGQLQAAGPVAAGLPVGARENLVSNVATMTKHFESLQDQASGAPLVQSLRSNITSLADKAATGTGQDKKAYVDGLLQAFHIPGATGKLKTNTDLLEKYMAQVNMGTPAATDAARNLVTAGRPHASMTAAAIKESISQVASQVETNMAERNYLSQYKYANGGQGDIQGYQTARQNFESNADPRIWQFKALGGASTPEGKKFFLSLPADEQHSLKAKVQNLIQMGALQ